MRKLIWCVCTLFLFYFSTSLAQEQITDFKTDIVVQSNGDFVITESITVQAEGQQIKRGIFRELPRTYLLDGKQVPYNYKLLGITHNGVPAKYLRSRVYNTVNWRIGEFDVFLKPGIHTYEISYQVPNQIRRFEDKDEIYWNATGNFWDFPILQATTKITFPPSSKILESVAYTGASGSTDQGVNIRQNNNLVQFKTNKTLLPREGLTVAAAIEKGVIQPPSLMTQLKLIWYQLGHHIVYVFGTLVVFLLYLIQWFRSGRDPIKPPVFPRYEPPKNLSAAALCVIYGKNMSAQKAFTAMLMQMGAVGIVRIKAEKKTTTIQLIEQPASKDGKALANSVFRRDPELVLDGKTNRAFYNGLLNFHIYLSRTYGGDLHKYNLGTIFLGGLISVLTISAAFRLGTMEPILIKGLVLFGINALFWYLIPAPTEKGAALQPEIEGFRLYLKTAEKDRINSANPLGQLPPAMSAELYEKYLPYAIALDIEEPWTKHFETHLPKVAENYQPSYATGANALGKSSKLMTGSALAKAVQSNVSRSRPPSESSSSSGSSGGGSSGGGGGGGGGGGW